MSNNRREKLLEVQNLSVTFGSKRAPFRAVDDVSFHIYKGETFGLVGESGSGKTTIGRSIIRINPISGGAVLYKGCLLYTSRNRKNYCPAVSAAVQ